MAVFAVTFIGKSRITFYQPKYKYSNSFWSLMMRQEGIYVIKNTVAYI